MPRKATRITRSDMRMSKAFVQLKVLMRDLALNLSVWDIGGKAIEQLTPGCSFCREICESRGRCKDFSREFSQQVVATGESATGSTEIGCCLVGVPLYQRRRLCGAAVGCFPVRQMLDEESLARLSQRLKLDQSVLAKLAAESIRRDVADASDCLRILDWVSQREQARVVASDELAILSGNLTTTYEELSLLYRISGSMRVTQQPGDFLANVCNELLEVMNVETAATLAYAHPPAIEEDLVAVSGQWALDEGRIKGLARDEITPQLTLDNRGILNNNFVAGSVSEPDIAIRNLIAVPLIRDNESLGMLIGLNKYSGDFDSVDLKLISAVASQVAVFLANHHLYCDLQDLFMGVLHALTATIDAKDPYTSGHSQRVALISKRLAEECGFDAEKVRQIYLAGLLHDIGKIGVPEASLCKEGKLTEEEYNEVKKHPALGAGILGGIRQLDEVISGILNHHERPDGKGYPRGLKAEEITIEGLIVGLADCFDAMSSDRVYRNALPLDAVIGEIRRNAGTQFDADLADKFLSLDLEEFTANNHQPDKTVFPCKVQQEPKR